MDIYLLTCFLRPPRSRVVSVWAETATSRNPCGLPIVKEATSASSSLAGAASDWLGAVAGEAWPWEGVGTRAIEVPIRGRMNLAGSSRVYWQLRSPGAACTEYNPLMIGNTVAVQLFVGNNTNTKIVSIFRR